MGKLIEVWTTCPTKLESNRIAKLAIEQNLCACAHVIPVGSFYRWNGKVEASKEFRIAFRTSKRFLQKLKLLIDSEHSYDLPAFCFIEIDGGSTKYLKWIEQSGS